MNEQKRLDGPLRQRKAEARWKDSGPAERRLSKQETTKQVGTSRPRLLAFPRDFGPIKNAV